MGVGWSEAFSVVFGLIAVAIVVTEWRSVVRFRRELRRGDVGARTRGERTHGEIVEFLNGEYAVGALHAATLEAAAALTSSPTDDQINSYICLEVAAGRYREALSWRARWGRPTTGTLGALVLINEAEALASLGRTEEALEHVSSLPECEQWVAWGLAAHRAWVLAELGRVEELPEAVREVSVPFPAFPDLYVAELHFSRFAAGLALRDFTLAHEALAEAELHLARESSRRNLHFYRGRLALAEGRDAHAFIHFERGAQSPYKWQGGTSLLEWGDALKRLDREDEAREKWTWCVEQDPQSPAAVIARTRLEQVVAA